MTLVRDLSVAEQQLVEIARALSMRSRLIVMDEPTSALSETEVANLAGIVRRLQGEGLSIIFVTHRLEEVFRLCDRYTVLRDGRFVGAGRVARHQRRGDHPHDGRTRRRCALRRAADSASPGRSRSRSKASPAGAPRGIPMRSNSIDVSLRAHKGEILGLAGLVGAGRTETARAIFGADRFDAGAIDVAGEAVSFAGPAGRDARAASASCPKTARSRRCSCGSRSAPMSRSPRTTRSAALRRLHRRARKRSGWSTNTPPAQHPHGEPGSGGRQSLRRQPAEGRARALAGAAGRRS